MRSSWSRTSGDHSSWRSSPRPLEGLARWLAFLFAGGATLALLTVALPRTRPTGTVAAGLLAAGAYAAASVLWLRAGTLRLRRIVLLGVAGTLATVLAAVTAVVAGGGGQITVDRSRWLLMLGAGAVGATTIRQLICQLRLKVAELERLSHTDPLTGLANRRAWDEELVREFARARREGSAVCVALLDVDRFKAFNDVRGHPEGDRLLQRAAAGWLSVLRDVDLLARHGGEEFALALRGCTIEQAAAVVERMRLVMPEEQTASAGLARWDGSETADALMRRVDEALYAAKAAGRDRLKLVDPDVPTAGPTPAEWGTVIHELLEERSVVAVYQPVVRLETGEVVAYEALARPNHEDIDISVERMFATAQRMGLGRDLDWLCRRAAIAGAHWLPPQTPLFINCGVSGLVDPVHRVDQMLLVLAASGRSPREVVLEITEREIAGDLRKLRSVVTTYRQEGFRFAVDDVGEGHSTLEVLAAVSPEFIKVARPLVVDAAGLGARAAIRSLVAFAEETGAGVIAEGIEQASTAERMRILGVGFAQGYMFGRPGHGAATISYLPPRRAPAPADSVDDRWAWAAAGS